MTQSKQIELLVSELFNKYGQVALDTKTTATLLGKSEISLKKDRSKGDGVPYSKVGGLIRYSITEIAKYIIENSTNENENENGINIDIDFEEVLENIKKSYTPSSWAKTVNAIAFEIAKQKSPDAKDALRSIDFADIIRNLKLAVGGKPKTLEECGAMYDNADTHGEKLVCALLLDVAKVQSTVDSALKETLRIKNAKKC